MSYTVFVCVAGVLSQSSLVLACVSVATDGGSLVSLWNDTVLKSLSRSQAFHPIGFFIRVEEEGLPVARPVPSERRGGLRMSGFFF